MKLLTIYISIFAMLNLSLSPAYSKETNSPSPPKKSSGQNYFSKIFDAQAAPEDENTVKDAEKAKKEAEKKAYEVTESSEDTAVIVLSTFVIAVMAISAPIFIVGCRKADTVIHAIGAGIMVALEGVYWGLYKKGSTLDMEIHEKKGSNYSEQVVAFETAMIETKMAATWMTAKFGTLVAIAVIIGIAMGVVLIRSIIQTIRTLGIAFPYAQSCAGPVTYNNPFKEIDPIELYSEQRKGFNLPLGKKQIIKRLSKATDMAELTFIDAEINNFNNGEIKSQSIYEYEVLTKDKELSSIIEKYKGVALEYAAIAENILIQNAHAEASPTDGSSSSGDDDLNAADLGPKLAAMGLAIPSFIGSIIAIVKGMNAIKKVNGWARASIYTVEIVLLSILSNYSIKTASDLNHRAEKYKELFEQTSLIMKNQEANAPGASVPLPPATIMANAESAAVQELEGHCFTNGPNDQATPDPSCGCKTSNTCKKTEIPETNFPEFKTPTTLTTNTRLAEQMGNQVYSGDMAGANLSAQSLGKNAVAVNKMNDALVKLANDKAVEYGQKPMDFDKMVSDNKKKVMDDMSNTFNSLSAQEQASLLKDAGVKEEEKAEKETVASAEPGKPSGTTGTDKKGSKKSIFQFLGKDKDGKKDPGASSQAEGELKKLDDYEDSTDQITNESAKNIFKIIEIRYMKSAYPIFFQEKE